MAPTENTGGAAPAANSTTATTKKKKSKRNKKRIGNNFKGDATADSVLYNKVITPGKDQAAQIINLEAALSSHIGKEKFPDWAESIRNNTRKTRADFMPAAVNKLNYGAFDNAGVFVFNGANATERYEQEQDFDMNKKIWESEQREGIRKWNKYQEHSEALFLTIKGQIDRALWDRTMDDAQFAAVEAGKCPIALLNLIKNRCTGAVAGLWEPLAIMKQLITSTNAYQRPKGCPAMSIGDYKRSVESNVATACRMGGDFAYGTKLMELVLNEQNPVITLAQYFALAPVDKRPYDILYEDAIVAIIITKGCMYSSLREFLAQQELSGNSAYSLQSNELVEMINSGNFAPDPPWVHKNQKNKQNKGNNEETVGAVITHETETDSEDSESDTESEGDSDEENESEGESEEESEDENEIVSEDTGDTNRSTRTARFEHILACIESGKNGDGSEYNTDITEEEYYSQCDGFGQVIAAVIEDDRIQEAPANYQGDIPVPSYDDDDYNISRPINLLSGEFESVRNMYQDEKYHSLTYQDRRQLEFKFFTGSTCPLMLHEVGDPATLYPEVAREHARRRGVDPEAMAKSGPNGHDSLQIVLDRVSELMSLDHPKMKLDRGYSSRLFSRLQHKSKVKITDADGLRSRTQEIANNRSEITEFMASILPEGQKEPDPREWFYLKGCSRDMCDRYDWDHEYFQRMSARWHGDCLAEYKKIRDAEFVGAVIVNMPPNLSGDASSSDDESMPGLEDRALDDWSSVSSADSDDDDSIYTDGEMTGWKHQSILEIISGQRHGTLKERSAAKNSEHRLGMGTPVLFNYAILKGSRPKKARVTADFR